MVETAAKVLFFAVFTALLYFVINLVLNHFKDLMSGVGILNNINFLLCWIGVYKALNLLLSMIIGNWFVTKILKYASF